MKLFLSLLFSKEILSVCESCFSSFDMMLFSPLVGLKLKLKNGNNINKSCDMKAGQQLHQIMTELEAMAIFTLTVNHSRKHC